MLRIDVRTFLDLPVQEVRDFLIDLTSSPHWTRRGSEPSHRSAAPLGVGATIESVRSIFGQRIKSQTLVLAQYGPGHVVSSVAAVPRVGRAAVGSALAVLFCVLMLVAPVGAASNTAYLAEMPTAADVIAKTTGKDPFDTSARQYATFERLAWIMRDMQGNRQFGKDITAAETALMASYHDTGARIAADLIASLPASEQTGANSKRHDWYTLEAHYEADPTFNAALLKTFFSSTFRASYAKAHAAGEAAAAAGEAAIEAGSAPRPGSQGAPDAGVNVPGVIALFTVIVLVGAWAGVRFPSVIVFWR